MAGYGRIFLTAVIAVVMSSNLASAQQQPQDDRCKATDTDRQAENKTNDGQAAPGDPSKKLSDCGSVLKPPAVGDSKMEKPAPDVGNTPIIKPGETQPEQGNNQQPSK